MPSIADLSHTFQESTEDSDTRINCYACGDPNIDPTLDNEEYCDEDKDDDCSAESRMYNHTCDIMDR